ncbi:gamma-glutamyl-gamma-aminobutyrate hydrolase family protein [Nocardioides jejuensis]|uniref:Gamma-glutamyl-gamma-aminobutyrate hydrolase family protein n=1 Tax=Nocardioides jejuensis TaxID=2502782 RepID=A0A4V2P008_9ACTN|nr:gamma-glutamyl-gamma-aminobutyrate hydrolase family protein [Nocardioides jejuensis]TCJ31102.1 gamma-glutamyl-gamma-aminobutyrate hydrolase family protein [Nocardioides jejuensis]
MGARQAPDRRPLIGITGRRFRLSLIDGADPRYGDRCIDTSLSDFASRIAGAGGVPVTLSYDAEATAACEWLSGVVIAGGQDVHPACWGGDTSVVRDIDPRTNTQVHDVDRDAYEIALVRAALERGIPVLGVCRGLQVLNVALGGTLVADLPEGPVSHLSSATAPTDGTADHVVTFAAGSLARSLFGEQAQTNSWHHQAVDVCGTGLLVTGRAGDGVVEAVELPGAPVLGVQWHPEWMASDDPAMSWIVRAATEHLTSGTDTEMQRSMQ